MELVDVKKLHSHFNGRQITYRIPHTLKAAPVFVRPGTHGNMLCEKAFVHGFDKPFEVYGIAARLFALDGEGRPLEPQPSVVSYFLNVCATSPSMNERFGDIRATYDAKTPNSVFYALPSVLTMTRGDAIDLVIDTISETFEVALHNGTTLRFASIRVQAALEGAALVLAPAP